MYQYEQETVTFDIDGWALGAGNIYSISEDFFPIIQRRSENGWRYVGYIPTKQRGTGHTEEIALIFEREI